MRLLPLSSFALALALLTSTAFAEEKSAPLSACLQSFVDDHVVSGAVTMVVSPDKILSLDAIGVSDLATKKSMEKDTLFWIASMTKPMTAMAVMMLVEEGKISVEDPVEKYLPEFKGQMLSSGETLVKPARAITVKDLLTHSSGLLSKLSLEPAAIEALTLQQAVAEYAKAPLQFEPGSKWSYCNPGINTLGRIVEVVSGMPYEQFMQERFFTPLGMKDTTFWPTAEQAARIARSYKANAEKTALEETIINPMTTGVTNRKRMPMASGGLFSTAPDLARVYQMVLNKGTLGRKQYLKEATLKEMTTNQLGDMPKVSFAEGMNMGLGFHIVKTPMGVTEALSPGSFGHGGAYGTQAWIDPVRNLAVVLLIQRAGLPNSDGSDMRGTLQKAAMAKFGQN